MNKDKLRGEAVQLYSLLAITVDQYRDTIRCTPKEYTEIIKGAFMILNGNGERRRFLLDKFRGVFFR